MRKVLMTLAASLMIAASAAAGTVTGALGGLPWAYGFDWAYSVPTEPRTAIATQQVVSQATFVWPGASGPVATGQHAVLALTQTTINDRFSNNAGDPIWTHGAGVIVGEFGLGLELWVRENLGGGSYGPANAYVWKQTEGRCMKDVLGTIPNNSLCLPGVEGPGAYITEQPGFILQRNTPYTVRLLLNPQGPWVELVGELWSPSGELLQRGRVGFQADQFFPDPAQPLRHVVARTPGSPSEPQVTYRFTRLTQ